MISRSKRSGHRASSSVRLHDELRAERLALHRRQHQPALRVAAERNRPDVIRNDDERVARRRRFDCAMRGELSRERARVLARLHPPPDRRVREHLLAARAARWPQIHASVRGCRAAASGSAAATSAIAPIASSTRPPSPVAAHFQCGSNSANAASTAKTSATSARPFARSATPAATAHIASSHAPTTHIAIRGAGFRQRDHRPFETSPERCASHSPPSSAASGELPGKKRNGSPNRMPAKREVRDRDRAATATPRAAPRPSPAAARCRSPAHHASARISGTPIVADSLLMYDSTVAARLRRPKPSRHARLATNAQAATSSQSSAIPSKRAATHAVAFDRRREPREQPARHQRRRPRARACPRPATAMRAARPAPRSPSAAAR